jgi:putative serine protease PepD
MITMNPSSRPLAVAGAALALGAGGGVGAATIFSHPTVEKTTTIVQPSSASSVAAVSTTRGSTIGEIYRQDKQSVVEIKTGEGEGSGFVLDSNGDVVTNEHVVSGSSTVQVLFADGRRATARVVDTDPSTDVAVVRVSGVPSSELKPLTFADSSKVAVGDPVVAIGTPYGLAGSVTTGIISALDRTITSPSNFSITGTLQTDAAINPGNSGGPLLNAEGDVIGMNSQIESSSRGNTGVGFAIASNAVRRVAQQLAQGKSVQHAYLGVALGDADHGGASIGSVRSGGPADSAGLQTGDVITAIDGKAISSGDDAVNAIDAHSPGDKITVTVLRGGAHKSIDVTLGTRPAS